MKVLLINSNRFKHPWPVIPIGLCYVAAAVEAAGHEVQVLDLCFSDDCAQDIENSIRAFKPDVMGIGVRHIDNGVGYNTVFLLDEVRDEVVGPCKRYFQGPIVLGGAAIGINGVEILSYFDLEYAIRGDGESGMVAFLSRLENSRPLTGCSGLIIRREGNIVRDAPVVNDVDINAIPFPSPHRYLNLKPYLDVSSPLQIQTKRGCALKCSYCIYNLIEGRTYRLRHPQSVVEEIEELVNATGSNHVEFIDSTFNIPLDHCKEVLRAIIASGLKLKLRAMGMNPRAIDDELIDLLQEAGFVDVDLGVESACDITLKSLGKNFNRGHVMAAGKHLRRANISASWFLLLGSMEESRETLLETFESITQVASRWDLIIISVGLRVYHNSPMAARMLRENKACTGDNFLHPVRVEPERLDVESIKLLTRRAAFQHANFYMYDEYENSSLPLLRIGCLIFKWFAPRQPVWKWFILITAVQNWIGITPIRRLWFEIRHRKRLREIAGGATSNIERAGRSIPADALGARISSRA